MTMVDFGVPVRGDTEALESWILDGAAAIGAAMRASRNVAVARAAIHGQARCLARRRFLTSTNKPPRTGYSPVRARGCPRREGRAMVLGSRSGSPSGGLDPALAANPVPAATARELVRCGLDGTLGRPPQDDDPECSWPAVGESP